MSLKILLSALAVSTSVLASSMMDYAEVIPGPGLPSLASLNVTIAELHETSILEAGRARMEPLQARDASTCGPGERDYTNTQQAVACYHYLNGLGTQACTAHPLPNLDVLCTVGDTRVSVFSKLSEPTTSHCQDVAYAVLWVLDHCSRNDRGDTAGWHLAYGNGDMIVHTTKMVENWAVAVATVGIVVPVTSTQ